MTESLDTHDSTQKSERLHLSNDDRMAFAPPPHGKRANAKSRALVCPRRGFDFLVRSAAGARGALSGHGFGFRRLAPVLVHFVLDSEFFAL